VCSSREDGIAGAWIDLAGELDMATASQLEQTLADEARTARLVVVDLREVEFIDRSGVDVIVNASRAARYQGRRLIMVRAATHAHDVFELTGAATHVDIVDVDLDCASNTARSGVAARQRERTPGGLTRSRQAAAMNGRRVGDGGALGEVSR
jgi:anti-anti-sigma factor